MPMMTDILAAAERVKTAVEDAERYLYITDAELDRLYTYQFTTPTAPKPGFQYKREYWRMPHSKDLWCGPNESAVRVAIGAHKPEEGPREKFTPARYTGPLYSFWFVFTCESDPRDRMYTVHRPKEVKVIQ